IQLVHRKTDLQETKDFVLKQGGRCSEGKRILRYVTEFTGAASAAPVKKIRFVHKEFAWRL
ncbi:hypothetical protein, partial [Erwinia amylovora]|uniref:hypothetical protein n=1 Tax=Erwinia amylovora TaxID=552 RepID=UPI001963492D